jgi:hypothetical protein
MENKLSNTDNDHSTVFHLTSIRDLNPTKQGNKFK